MEKAISQEERLRRAEEIYQRRKMANRSGVRVASSSVNNTKTKFSLFKKMILQLAICAVIYIIFYLIKNTNYIFSENVINKTKELLSYDIDLKNVYTQVNSFIENNKDKLKIPGITEDGDSASGSDAVEEKGEQQNEVTNQEIENQSTEEVNNQEGKEKTNDVNDEGVGEKLTNEVKSGGIGGAEINEIQANKLNEQSKKTQMELDAEYIKTKYNFKIPLKGTITSRYGEREKTDIISANHSGIDIGASLGATIYAAMEGTVTVASSEGEYRQTY